MSLRRLAATNAASISSPGPRSSQGSSTSASSPASPSAPPPTTPSRASTSSYGYVRSPVSIPSQSSSVPFDWEAARTLRAAPFATPKRGRKSTGTGTPTGPNGTPRRVVRKKGIVEKITDIPSKIAFEIALFPHNVPLPTPQNSALTVGGLMHFLHFCVRVGQMRRNQMPESEAGWEDMWEENGNYISTFDWTLPMLLVLFAATFWNVGRVLTSIRLYRMHRRKDPVSSPRASFIAADLDTEALVPPSLVKQFLRRSWGAFTTSWRFLLNRDHVRVGSPISGRTSRILQLEMWMPGEFEMMLACVYSPAHWGLWSALNAGNWYCIIAIMLLVSAQMKIMCIQYEGLIKDKEIVAAEVMSEYQEGFVNPRVNPIRHDQSIQTHQAEIVNVWED